MTTPVVLIHGFIGTLDVIDLDGPHAAPDLLGYGAERAAPVDAISLPGQVEYVREFIDHCFGATPVDVVGHSVGGAIAMLLAHTHPQYVRRLVNVEGNFTLDDAFWSASVGRMSTVEADVMLRGFRQDPLAWLSGAVAEPSEAMLETAIQWLDFQPASTLRAMGQSVVTTTGDARYLEAAAAVFASHPVYLIAGERSRDGWNAPAWAWERCAGYRTVAGCGHLMMLEDPEAFSAAIRRCLAT
jgi:pimeloyl-ACP methyl ester carboxylesterase